MCDQKQLDSRTTWVGQVTRSTQAPSKDTGGQHRSWIRTLKAPNKHAVQEHQNQDDLDPLWMIRDNSYCMGFLRLTVLSSQLSLGHGQADDLHHNPRASRPAAATTAAAAAAESAAAAVAAAALASQGPKMIGF